MSEYEDGVAGQVADQGATGEPAAPQQHGVRQTTDQHPAQPQPTQQRTGDDRVDAALSRLAGLGDLPLAAQVTVFDDVHRLLQDALTAGDPTGGATTDPAGVGTASR